MTCEFAHYDGAYVLGALSPAERSEFQAHLKGCDECTRATLELAGLPGLLARVPQDVLESASDDVDAETMLPALMRKTQVIQRRRMWTVIGTAAAAVVIAGGSLAFGLASHDDDRSSAQPTPSVSATGKPMVRIGSEPMSANVALTTVAWGTRVDLSCSYPSHSYGSGEPGYAMFIRTRDGKVEQVATWRAEPGKTMRLAAATAEPRKEIASVEIRTAAGEPVLKTVS